MKHILKEVLLLNIGESLVHIMTYTVNAACTLVMYLYYLLKYL